MTRCQVAQGNQNKMAKLPRTSLNFGQYNQDKPFKKKRPENVNFWKKLLEEVTMVVKEIFFKEADTIFRQEVAPTGARNAPISQCNFVYKLPLPW